MNIYFYQNELVSNRILIEINSYNNEFYQELVRKYHTLLLKLLEHLYG